MHALNDGPHLLRNFQSSRLERNGPVSRYVIPAPLAVQYEITPLGNTLLQPLRELHAWTLDKLPLVEDARNAFDLQNSN
ncbi:hypothetical protein [Luteimonas sp. 3794]|uniref:hypothetical protein n=1 Tax=Luteimonas sp. 3794 TaxID=2817730 RepID=UPI00285C4A66|nr:hypothetical protein [Luteimonas sp. 3794]MDR6990676.1 DNA-binding HxlR family transcriptional regulator [Luteimonas sp. 3794]